MSYAVKARSMSRVQTRGDEGHSGTLRSRQLGLTRELILSATAQAVAEDPLLGFSMQEVADRAGVSIRSLYRHFPSRKQLFEALYDWVSERTEVPALVQSIRSSRDLPSFVRELFSRFESEGPVLRAMVVASVALGTQPSRQSQSDNAVVRLLRKECPNLDPEEARRAAAIVRLLLSSRAWLLLSERYRLDARSAATAVEWALGVLTADLRDRSQHAGH